MNRKISIIASLAMAARIIFPSASYAEPIPVENIFTPQSADACFAKLSTSTQFDSAGDPIATLNGIYCNRSADACYASIAKAQDIVPGEEFGMLDIRDYKISLLFKNAAGDLITIDGDGSGQINELSINQYNSPKPKVIDGNPVDIDKTPLSREEKDFAKKLMRYAETKKCGAGPIS